MWWSLLVCLSYYRLADFQAVFFRLFGLYLDFCCGTGQWTCTYTVSLVGRLNFPRVRRKPLTNRLF